MHPQLKMYVWAEGNHRPPVSQFADTLSFTDQHSDTQLSPERETIWPTQCTKNNSLLCIKTTQLWETLDDLKLPLKLTKILKLIKFVQEKILFIFSLFCINLIKWEHFSFNLLQLDIKLSQIHQKCWNNTGKNIQSKPNYQKFKIHLPLFPYSSCPQS